MNYPEIEYLYLKRHEMKNDLGGVEVPQGSINDLQWNSIPKDCLPVVIIRSNDPKGLICANRVQFDTARKNDPQHPKECYIVEISRLIKHSNLPYAEDLIEKDRTFKHKRQKLLLETQKEMAKDVIQFLNRTKTALEIAAKFNTTAPIVKLMAVRLRKAGFNIPLATGLDGFNIFTQELAKEMPQYVKAPMAPLPTPQLKEGIPVLETIPANAALQNGKKRLGRPPKVASAV